MVMTRPIEVTVAFALIITAFALSHINTNWPLSLRSILPILLGLGISVPILFMVFRLYTGDWLARLLFVPVAIGISALQYFQAFVWPGTQYTTDGMPPMALIPENYMAVFSAACLLIAAALTFTPASNRWYQEKRRDS